MPSVPFSFLSPYGWNVLLKEISISFLLYSYLVTAIMAIAFGTFLWLRARKLSSFYLFLICLCFSMYSILDLLAWTPTPAWGIQMFSWSILDTFCTSFFIFSYWFLYAFIKDRDLPYWQKIITGVALAPTVVIAAISVNLSSYSVPVISAVENINITKYLSWVHILFIVIVALFTIKEYIKTDDRPTKNKIALAGTGVFIFLFTFNAVVQIIDFVMQTNLFGLGVNAYIYNIDSYSLFGMPILLAFLGYLVAKYQAFDVKLIKSSTISLIIMALLFIGLFFT